MSGRPIGPAHFPIGFLTRGTLVAGMIGSGKTNTVMNLVHQVHKRASALVFDVKKEYRCLHKTLGANVYGFAGPNLFTHNLLKPVGPPALWVKQFSSILSEVINRYVPAVGSKDVVAEELDNLYRERGVYEGSVNYPHVGDLTDRLEQRAEQSSGREGGWLASALRVLRTLRIGSTRQAFEVREGLALERLLSGVTVIEFGGIGDKAAESLLASVLVQKIRNTLENEPPANTLKHLIVVEEAQHLLAQGQEATSVLTTTCREIRAFGVGLVYVTQMPSELSRHALANVHNVIIHRLVHPADKSLASSLLGLDAELKNAIERLDVGTALFKSETLALIRVPRVDRPIVHDSELSKTVETREEVATHFGKRTDVENRVRKLGPRDEEILVAIAVGRAVHPSGLRDELERSYKEVNAALGHLISLGLAWYCKARKGGKGKPRKVFFLSPDGEEAYRQLRGRYPDRKASPSPDHKQLLTKVVERLGAQRIPDRRIDILYEEDGVLHAVEVETGANNDRGIEVNLVKQLTDFPSARFVGADQTVYNRILQAAAKIVFAQRRALSVELAVPEALPDWTSFSFEAVSLTP